MPYSRDIFFNTVRADLHVGKLSQSQVNGYNYLLSMWETHFEERNPRDGTNWLSYCLATTYHETAKTIQPIEEYDKGKGKKYGVPAGPYNHIYYGRGYVQLTWLENYEKGTKFLLSRYNVSADLVKRPELMLELDISALVMYDGMEHGWFTGIGLPKYFNSKVEDPINARRIVNALDKAEMIARYYWQYKLALIKVELGPEPAPPVQVPTLEISSDMPVKIRVGNNVEVVMEWKTS